MSGDVLLESLDQERVYDFRLVVRSAFIEALIKGKQMTCCTCVGESHGGHQLAAGNRLGGLKTFRDGEKKYIAVLVADSCGTVCCIRIGQVGDSGRGAMTIVAFEVYQRAVRTAADGFHVNRVIQPDGCRIDWRNSLDRT